MPEEVGIYDDGSLIVDTTYTSNQIDNLIDQGKMEVNNDNIIMENTPNTYLAIEVTDVDEADVYVALKSNVDFNLQSIKSDPLTSATFELEEEQGTSSFEIVASGKTINTLELNDEIRIDDQYFNFISSDSNAGTITMFAKYNLNVGSYPYGTADNKQNSNMVGLVSSDYSVL